mmetsp:Transcript_6423/g.10518  ORF Transcript_6423/g.10518 Transcript_6423/m.10518 type:complete len:170 (+) Transcript_6423:89-598(+)
MTPSDPAEPGQYDIHFRHSHATHEYRVITLGPLDSNGMYAYTVVSDSSGQTMWVLARNVTEFFAVYDADVLLELEQLGFNDGNTTVPVKTYQNGDCVYEDLTPVMPVHELVVPQYMGLWYEMYTDDFADSAWANNTYFQKKTMLCGKMEKEFLCTIITLLVHLMELPAP